MDSRPLVLARSVKALAGTRIVRPYGPRTLYGLASSLLRWGTGLAGGYAALAARYPDETAVVDDAGSRTFGQLHREANALADSLARLGVVEGDGVAVMCRNHGLFVEASVAVNRLGADVLYLNTAFSGPQLVEVLERHRPRAVIYDDEFTGLLADAPGDIVRVRAWVEETVDSEVSTVQELIRRGSSAERTPPERQGRSTILTSGTTGTPKGASRGAGSIGAAAALVSRIPLRHRMTVHIAAPLFHTWGWGHLNLGMLVGSTLVLRRRFEPEDFLETLERNACDVAVVVPVMLQRTLALPDDRRAAYDLSSVGIVAASGSALPGDVGLEWMDAFGDNLYNTYGSTECAWATIATPAELRAHPGTAGRAPVGTEVRLYGDDDREVPAGETGRIFVTNSMLFEGYTGGGGKQTIGDAMATGDVGRMRDGLLFVEGRDDDMIVSGGENVFPQEVEDCLMRLDDVVEVAIVGVADDEFGQRLRAYVATVAGASLTEDDVRQQVKDNLARYKVPRDVRFVAALPRNATGKILKKELE
ncbi:AMP-binding protein [Solicola gregarius]|uniref:AMP-binding protein n=1 Tax=Solicola gregarius TaxID=2908642 RepID=A0AA46YLI2_9ACTN|nr:AMP-binding protein [Solicola gregarius]UYM05609.1 AMP-binding protein [Solicola gregarius]